MAKYKKQTGGGGKWAKGSELINVKKAKIVSETNPETSNFSDKEGNVKIQDVCKVRFEGIDEVLKVSLNRATKNGLIDAFGEDSKDWMGHYLRVEIEKGRIGGKSVVFLYLIPEGYHKEDDENGFAVILKDGATVEAGDAGIKPEDLPF